MHCTGQPCKACLLCAPCSGIANAGGGWQHCLHGEHGHTCPKFTPFHCGHDLGRRTVRSLKSGYNSDLPWGGKEGRERLFPLILAMFYAILQYNWRHEYYCCDQCFKTQSKIPSRFPCSALNRCMWWMFTYPKACFCCGFQMSHWGSATWILDLSRLRFGLSWKDFPKWSKTAASGVRGKPLPGGFKHTWPPPAGLWLFRAPCPTKAHAVFDPLSRREQQKDSVWEEEKGRTSVGWVRKDAESNPSAVVLMQNKPRPVLFLPFKPRAKEAIQGLGSVTVHLEYHRHTVLRAVEAVLQDLHISF